MSRPQWKNSHRSFPNWKNEVSKLRNDVSVGGPEASVKSLGRLADLLRMNPTALDESIRLQRRALRAANGRAQVVSRLRLATALHYKGKFAEALREFNSALALAKRGRYLRIRDFIYQHRGKCLSDAGRHDEALRDIEEALRLRRRRNAVSLIKSSLHARREVERRRKLSEAELS